jgi:TPR repeat protein
MRIRGGFVRSVAFAFGLIVADAAFAFSDDPPGRFLPGNYLEYRAQFYLRKGDYEEALRLFELSGYWANKVAQYNVGIMYFNGIGSIPRDRVRGTAWLGIAAEQHGETADAALHAAWDKLTPAEREEADRVFRELDRKYGDRIAFRRARQHYESERRSAVGTRVGMLDNMIVVDANNLFRSGDGYYADQDGAFADYMARLGQVAVGEIRDLPMPPDARGKPAEPQNQR